MDKLIKNMLININDVERIAVSNRKHIAILAKRQMKSNLTMMLCIGIGFGVIKEMYAELCTCKKDLEKLSREFEEANSVKGEGE